MSVRVAKTAGFCFGVKRAVDMAFQAARGNGPVRTLGELIHNPQIVAELDALRGQSSRVRSTMP